MVESHKAAAQDFKFFYGHLGKLNYGRVFRFNDYFSAWEVGVVDSEISNGRWDVVKVPVDLVLLQDGSTNLWLYFQ